MEEATPAAGEVPSAIDRGGPVQEVGRMRALIAWSSGKDSAWALHVARAEGIDVVGALTTITDEFARVSMHAVREVLLDAQLAAAGLPSWKVRIPWPCPNDAYEARMAKAIAPAR